MDQLTAITAHTEYWSSVLEADPVRPHISHWQRIAANRECFVIHEGIRVKSVLCCAYVGGVPIDEPTLFQQWTNFSVVCFYSVWSFERGYGRQIINSAMSHIRWSRPEVYRAVTLSPKTEVAHKFHRANGAKLLQENPESLNFEYVI